MTVYLYNGGMKLVGKSGVGQALVHQRDALRAAGIRTSPRLEPDTQVVHINTIFPDSLLAIAAARRKGKKVIYYAHSTMEDFRASFKGSNLLAPLFKRWITFCYNRGDVIVTPTEYSRKLLLEYGIHKPIFSVSNGIDTQKFYPDPERGRVFRRRYKLTETDHVVISAGHLIERKGILDYISLARKMPDVKFFWFGHTDPILIPKAVKQEIERAPGNLSFPGYVDQSHLRDAYCGADVFAFMSKEETEGIVVLEALACGVPTVVRDIPVYDGWLTDGETVYKAAGEKAFADIIRGLLSGGLPNLSEKGREVTRSRSMKMIGTKLKEIYEKEQLIKET